MSEKEALLCPDLTDENKKKTVIFVCTGNTCRSPMAAALFNYLFPDSNFRAASAGLAAYGECISENALRVLMERGVLPTPANDYTSHVSRTVDRDMLSGADAVIGITASHAMNLMFAFPEFASKISVMPRDISDPFGGDVSVYRRTLEDIESALKEIFAEGGGNTESGEC